MKSNSMSHFKGGTMSNDHAVSILLTEYKEIKQEIRDQITSMDVNMRTGMIFIGAFIGAAFQMNDMRPIYLIPSFIFFFSIIHALKTSSMNHLGTYIQFLDKRIKKLVDKDQIGMCWEGYFLWENQTQPTGPVVFSLVVLYAFWIFIFILISFYSYDYWPWSVYIHAIQGILLIIFAVKTVAENTLDTRLENIKKLEESIQIEVGELAENEQGKAQLPE
jgi:hypothetical protein